MSIKSVAFDIDGTLYSAGRFNLQMVPFGLRHLRFMVAFAATRRELHRRAIAATSSEEGRGRAAFRREQAAILASKLGLTPEEAEATAEAVIYGELERCFERVRPFPGVKPALEALRAGGLRLAALSDFPAEDKLRRLGLDAYFELARTSEDSGLLKPAAEPFLALARELGLTPREVLYVGNSLRYDLVGARNAGMHVAILTRRPAPGATLRFTDWRDLVRFALDSR